MHRFSSCKPRSDADVRQHVASFLRMLADEVAGGSVVAFRVGWEEGDNSVCGDLKFEKRPVDVPKKPIIPERRHLRAV